MTPPPRRVIVLGGGTAGWMAACLIAHRWGSAGCSVTVVEAPGGIDSRCHRVFPSGEVRSTGSCAPGAMLRIRTSRTVVAPAGAERERVMIEIPVIQRSMGAPSRETNTERVVPAAALTGKFFL